MNTIETIHHRRAVKHFDKDYFLTEDEEHKLIEAAIQAPTAFNIQHWRFVILRDPELRSRIRKEFGIDQSQITDASFLVLFTADLKAWSKCPERYTSNAPREISEMLVGMIKSFYQERDWLQRDEAHRSIGMAMQNLMLSAHDLGYQSCPMIGFDIDKIAELVHLPDDHVMGPMVAIGKGIKEPWPKSGQLSQKELVFENSFNGR